MNKLKSYTRIFIFVTVAVIAIYDVWVISKGGPETSISVMMQKWAYEFPPFTFIMGFVMGHLFWPGSLIKKVLFKKDSKE